MSYGIYKVHPLVIKGYNDRRKIVQISIPNEKDVGEDSPHMFIFTRYERLFYEAVQAAISTFDENTADGVTVREAVEQLGADWSEASLALMRLVRFGSEFTDYLSAGPGVPHTPMCALCQVRQPHQDGADLCSRCLIEVLETPKEGR